MLTYPRFLEAIRELDLEALARSAHVTRRELDALIEGGRSPSPDIAARLAAVLDADADDLFHPYSDEYDLAPALSRAPSLYITDPETLRAVGRLT